MSQKLRVVVVGAGAIGGITAALLVKGGYDVMLVCKHQEIATLAAGTRAASDRCKGRLHHSGACRGCR